VAEIFKVHPQCMWHGPTQPAGLINKGITNHLDQFKKKTVC